MNRKQRKNIVIALAILAGVTVLLTILTQLSS